MTGKSLEELVKEFFSYLDYTETSDNGNVFHPITIGCCRVMMHDKVDNCLKAMKSHVQGTSTGAL